jgi:hypothetical protein
VETQKRPTGAVRGLRRLLLFQSANTFAEQFGWNFIFLYAFREHFSHLEIALYFIVEYGSCVLFIPLVRRLDILRSMRYGLVLRIAAFAIILRFFWQGQLYVAALLLGGFVTLFWIPYNTRYLELTTRENRAQSSAALFALFAVMGATLPVAAGFLVGLYGFQAVLLISIAALLAGLAASFWLEPAGEMTVDIRRMLSATRRVQGLLLCEGFWQGVFWLAVPLGLIMNLVGNEGYGAFYSFLGLLGGAASLLAGRWSDRRGSRGPIVVASALAGGAFSVAAALFTGNLALWTALMGLVYFSIYILFPFTFTVVTERAGSCAEAMTVREQVTNIGRVFGALAVVASLLSTGGLAPALAAGGLALAGLAGSYLMTRGEGAGRTVKDRPRGGLLGRDEHCSSTEAQDAPLKTATAVFSAETTEGRLRRPKAQG